MENLCRQTQGLQRNGQCVGQAEAMDREEGRQYAGIAQVLCRDGHKAAACHQVSGEPGQVTLDMKIPPRAVMGAANGQRDVLDAG